MKRKDNKIRVPEVTDNNEDTPVIEETEITNEEVTVIEDQEENSTELSKTDDKSKTLEVKKEKKKNDVKPVKMNLRTDKKNVPEINGKSVGFVVGTVIAVILIIGLTLFYSGGIKEKLQSPLLINGQPVDSAEFSFMYHYILIDNGVDIFAADTPEMLASPSEDPNFATQREFFLNLTAKKMQTTAILYDDAKAHGYDIEPEHYVLARAYVDWLRGKANELGISLDTYIKGVFGSQVDEQVVISSLAKQYFVEDYSSGAKLNELQASDEQAEAAYNLNRNAYDTVSYKILRITYEQRDQAFIDTANLHASQIVEEMGHDQSMFEAVAAQYFSGEAAAVLGAPDSTLVTDARYDDFTHINFRDWLFDEARTSGDTVIFNDNNGFPIILCFVERDRQTVPLRDVRFVHVITSEDGYTMSEAQLIAQNIFDMINDETDIQSVENLYTDGILDGNIVVTHSSDTYPSKYDGVLANWIFDPERESGNKAFLETNDGFYIIYMVSISENPEWYDRVNSFIRMQNYQAFMAEMESEYSYEFIQRGVDAIQDVP